MRAKQVEILAPAGNMASLRAAVVNGADAVYLGASTFSARAKAGNFNNEELVVAVKYCHMFGVRVYLAINTIIKRIECDKAVETVIFGKNAGVDAFIVQDLQFLEYLNSTMPDINVHLSTQAGVHNLAGARVAERLGVTRVILSREALPSDIKEICDKTTLEVECFIHGALCVGFSGNCYFSSLAAGLSGNRGRCLQLCRKSYNLDGRNGYWLSAKDLDLTKKINELMGFGVSSFKIEGRMRRPEYVGEAVRYYKLLTHGKSPSDYALKGLFNRGEGCVGYLNNPTENVIYPTSQNHIGTNIGRVYALNGKRAMLNLKKPLNIGDGIKFLRGGKEVGSASISKRGNETTFVGDVHVGDAVNITTDTELLSEISSRSRKLPVAIRLNVGENVPVSASMSCCGVTLCVESDFIAQGALNAPLTVADFEKCFKKTDTTEFEISKFDCLITGNVFIAKSALNSFRRNCFAALERELLRKYDSEARVSNNFSRADFSVIKPFNGRTDGIDTIIQTDDPDILINFTDLYDAVAYFPAKFDDQIIKKLENHPKKTYLVIPSIVRGGDIDELKQILQSKAVTSVIVNNIGGFNLCAGKEIVIGTGLNVINPNLGTVSILSPEYDGSDYGDNFVYSFGKFPLMTFSHCPKKTVNGGVCKKCDAEEGVIVDEFGNEFTLRYYRLKHCYCQLLNSIPIDAISTKKLEKKTKRFIDLIGYSKAECEAILLRLRAGEQLSEKYTNGYFNKKLI